MLLLRACFASFCGSDAPLWNLDATGPLPESHRWWSNEKYPLLIGQPSHECVGCVIESTSPAFAPGDFVAFMPLRQAGLAQVQVVPAARCVALDYRLGHTPALGPATPPLLGSLQLHHMLLAQPLSTVISAMDRLATVGCTVSKQTRCCVIGQGAMGILWARMLRRAGAAVVVGIDRIGARLAASRDVAMQAASHTIHLIDIKQPSEQVLLSKPTITAGAASTPDIEASSPSTSSVCSEDPESVARTAATLTGSPLFDIVVEAAGHGDLLATLTLGTRLVAPRGYFVAFGVPDDDPPCVPYTALFEKNVCWVACVHPHDLQGTMARARDLLMTGEVNASSLLTHRFTLDDVGEAMETFTQRRDGAIKVWVDLQ